MLASASQVRDDAAHAPRVEAGRDDGCCRFGGDHRVRASLQQNCDADLRQVHEGRAGHAVSGHASGEGYEAAVAYAVAAKMKYMGDDVRWVRVPFNAALAPGPKTFDANLSEFSITEQRKAAVDFSSPYFDVTQAVVTVKSSPAASVKTVHQLRTLRLGVQVGTTSYTAATSVDGEFPVEVYDTNGDAKMALSNGEIDALVADLPTAFSVANELRNGLMVGQLPSAAGDVEQLGIVLDKGSALTRCISWAVDTLRNDGTLGRLEQQWLTDVGKAPVLT
jgi:polar amino acid transport system substrate-binding protein